MLAELCGLLGSCGKINSRQGNKIVHTLTCPPQWLLPQAVAASLYVALQVTGVLYVSTLQICTCMA